MALVSDVQFGLNFNISSEPGQQDWQDFRLSHLAMNTSEDHSTPI